MVACPLLGRLKVTFSDPFPGLGCAPRSAKATLPGSTAVVPPTMEKRSLTSNAPSTRKPVSSADSTSTTPTRATSVVTFGSSHSKLPVLGRPCASRLHVSPSSSDDSTATEVGSISAGTLQRIIVVDPPGLAPPSPWTWARLTPKWMTLM